MTDSERNALVERYMPLVERIVRGLFRIRLIPRFIEINDVIQECALRLLTEIPAHDPESGGQLTTYLHWVIRRDAINCIEKQFRRDRYTYYSNDSDGQNGLEDYSDDQHRSHFVTHEDIKDALSARQYEVFQLVHVYGFTQEEAAKRLGTTQSAVSQVLGSVKNKFCANLIKQATSPD